MRKWLISILFLLFQSALFAQVSNTALVQTESFHDHQYDDYKVTYVFAGSKSAVVKYNPVSLVFGSLLYLYQSLISVQLSTKCSYEVSCSNFAKLAIKEFGPLKGIALGADRLTRCNQLSAKDIEAGDIDMKKMKLLDDISRYRVKKKKVKKVDKS